MSRLLFKFRSLELLEPYAMKVARTVLRGERGSNAPDLLDHRGLLHHSLGSWLGGICWRHIGLQSQRYKGRSNRRGCDGCGNRESSRETTQIRRFPLGSCLDLYLVATLKISW